MNIKINKENDGKKVVLVLEGRIDTVTSADVEKAVSENMNADEMVLDFANVDYISSAGLRVLLSTHKNFATKGGLTLINAGDSILDIFEVTGFKDILNIK